MSIAFSPHVLNLRNIYPFRKTFFVYKCRIISNFRQQNLFLRPTCYFIRTSTHPSAKHWFHGYSMALSFLPLLPLGGKSEKLYEWWGPGFVVCSRLSRIRRPVCINLSRESNQWPWQECCPLAHSLFICIRRQAIEIGKAIYAFSQPKSLFSQGLWQPFPPSTSQNSLGVSVSLDESQLPWGVSLCWLKWQALVLQGLVFVYVQPQQKHIKCCHAWIKYFKVNLIGTHYMKNNQYIHSKSKQKQ